MPTIAWEDSFAIGHETIDAQHRQLFQAIADLDQALRKVPVDRDRVFDCMLFLLDYTQRHFTEEEAVMQSCGFPGLDEHRAQHETLIASLHALSRQISTYSATDAVINEELETFLNAEWLKTHVLESDRKLTPFLAGRPG